MKTYMAKRKDISQKWYLVDAEGKTLGRLASQIAKVLRGKHKPIYTPHVDTGDFVVVINAKKIKVTGDKLRQKIYYRHSGYPGGFKATDLRTMLQKHPDRVIREAVKGMLPHNRLGRQMLSKLKVYPNDSHPHEAQKPEMVTL